ncbi:nascent polypeptide-associated complex subunit beta-like protein [Tanacetum coccineum]
MQSTLKRIGLQANPQIEEVNIFKDETVIQFLNQVHILNDKLFMFLSNLYLNSSLLSVSIHASVAAAVESGRVPAYPFLSLDPAAYTLTTYVSCFVVGKDFLLARLPTFFSCQHPLRLWLLQLDPSNRAQCGLLPES